MLERRVEDLGNFIVGVLKNIETEITEAFTLVDLSSGTRSRLVSRAYKRTHT